MGQLYIIKHCYKFCECLMSTCPYYSLRNTYFVLIRPPGTLVPKAFCFSRDVFLTRHRISELRRPIVAKLCTVISICVNFLTQVQKLGGPPLKKIFGRFYTTSDFHREYLRNETRYPKSERHTTSSHSSRVQPNKSGELWSSIHRVVHVSLDLPKSTFFDRLYFGP